MSTASRQTESPALEHSSSTQHTKLLEVAKYQRWVLTALLANIVIIAFFAGVFVGAISVPSGVVWAVRIVSLLVAVFMSVAAYLLSKQFYHVVFAVICALLMWIPFVSLLVLVIINSKATKYLQQHGVKVGFLGARI